MGDSNNGLHLSGILIAVVLLATWMFQSTPLSPTRPGQDEQLQDLGRGYQDVPARLWQDPFATVERFRDKKKQTSSPDMLFSRLKQLASQGLTAADISPDMLLPPPAAGPGKHDIASLVKHIDEHRDPERHRLTVIPVLINTAPYAEAKEHRIRMRTAVIAGLTRNGLVPKDSQHLGYWRTPPMTARKASDADQPVMQAIPELIMPYELFGSDDHLALVLWVPAESLARQPAYRLGRLAKELTDMLFRSDDSDHLVFLEAMGSDLLANMANTPDSELPLIQGLDNTTLIAATATTPAARLTDNCSRPQQYVPLADPLPWQEEELVDCFSRLGMTLVRAIATDNHIADSLVGELKLRHVDPACPNPFAAPQPLALWPCYEASGNTAAKHDPYYGHRDHVVLISEADTHYGRTLPRLFNREVARRMPQGRLQILLDAGVEELPWIHRFGYLRGVDGDLPNQKDANNNDNKQPSPNSLQGLEQLDSLMLEPSSGTSQFDYLRRLANSVLALEQRLRQQGLGRIKAIGILGNDLHDKLAILQVLREHFPKHQYFTNDLDARLLNPKNYHDTRNLIVASSYGLELSQHWQKKVAPLRGSYQTSVFLGTQLAIDANGKLPSSKQLGSQLLPRIFEVGRSRFIDLGTVIQPALLDVEEAPTLDLYPPSHQPPAPPRQLGWLLLMLVLALGLVTLLTPPLLSVLQKLWSDYWVEMLLAPFALILVMVAGVNTYKAMLASEEPFVWASGVSVWPSELLRILATLLSLLLLVLAIRRLEKDHGELAAKFKLGNCEGGGLPSRKDIWKTFSWFASTPIKKDQDNKITITALWCDYSVHARLPQRLARAFVLFLLLWLIAFIAIAFVQPMNVPIRGDFGYRFSFWHGMGPLGLCFGLLLFWVMDEAHLCRALIKRLCDSEQDWDTSDVAADEMPPSTPSRLDVLVKLQLQDREVSSHHQQLVADHVKQAEITDACLERKRMTIDFIARRTESASNVIWYPFVILILIVLSMSTRFDNYDTQGAVIGLLGVSIAIALSSAYLLRRTARHSKEHILNDLRTRMLSQKRERAAETPDKVELLIQQIEDIHQGAFRPWYQEPLLRALAWVGSMAAVIITEYLTVSG